MFADVFKTNGNHYDEIVKIHASRLAEIDNILPPSSIFFMLTNSATFQYEYLSQNVELALGLTGMKYTLMASRIS